MAVVHDVHFLLAGQRLPLLFLDGFKRPYQQVSRQVDDYVQLLPAAQNPIYTPLNILSIPRGCFDEEGLMAVFMQAAAQRTAGACVVTGDGNPVVAGGRSGQGLAEWAAAAGDKEGGRLFQRVSICEKQSKNNVVNRC